jgi:peptide chain release factor subunit 3
MPVIDKYKDMGTVVMGKIESGSIREGDSLLVMPNKVFFPIPYTVIYLTLISLSQFSFTILLL